MLLLEAMRLLLFFCGCSLCDRIFQLPTLNPPHLPPAANGPHHDGAFHLAEPVISTATTELYSSRQRRERLSACHASVAV
jgi:hypothetical protein